MAAAPAPADAHPRPVRPFRRLLGYGFRYWRQFIILVILANVVAATTGGRLLLIEPLSSDVLFPTEAEPAQPADADPDAPPASPVEQARQAATTKVGDTVVAVFGPPADALVGNLSPAEPDDTATHNRFITFAAIILALLCLTIVNGPVYFIYHYLGRWIGYRVMLDLQRTMQTHMVRLDMGFFVRHKQGDLMSRMSSDMQQVTHMIRNFFAETVVQILHLITGIAIIVFASAKLALVCLIVLPPLAIVLSHLSKKVRQWSRRSAKARGEVLDVMAQSITGMRVVKSFRREDAEVERFRTVTQAWLDRIMRTVRYATLNTAGLEFLYNLLIAVVMFIAGWFVLSGEISTGELLLFFGGVFYTFDPIRRLTRAFSVYLQALAAGERVLELMDIPPTITDAPDAQPLDAFSRGVEFDRVGFHYNVIFDKPTARSLAEAEGDAPVRDGAFELRDVTFTAPAGTVTALVGERGSGKSTILDLLLRLHDPTAGEIRIDGAPLPKIRSESLKRLFAVVNQETFLFHTSIAENIGYARPDATRDEIRAAAADANILEFIERQPDGFDTLVGERGARLSGGERQSIAIARAILADTPILVLDEATSNLDSVSEKRIQQAIERAMHTRTVFVVAHRLSTVRHADQIIVMERGRVAETGPHADLLAADGLYRRLHDTQFAGT
jgi:ABC-type multidrug transport system fused ATPase/permease subunit